MIKWLHIVGIMCLMAGSILSFVLSMMMRRQGESIQSCWYQMLMRLDGTLIAVLVLTSTLGFILVPQKGYFYSTPWIVAASILIVVILFCMILIMSMRWLSQRRQMKGRWSFPFYLGYVVWWTCLVLISHDAITKTTLLDIHALF